MIPEKKTIKVSDVYKLAKPQAKAKCKAKTKGKAKCRAKAEAKAKAEDRAKTTKTQAKRRYDGNAKPSQALLSLA